jgi:hypothetical protein
VGIDGGDCVCTIVCILAKTVARHVQGRCSLDGGIPIDRHGRFDVASNFFAPEMLSNIFSFWVAFSPSKGLDPLKCCFAPSRSYKTMDRICGEHNVDARGPCHNLVCLRNHGLYFDTECCRYYTVFEIAISNPQPLMGLMCIGRCPIHMSSQSGKRHSR